MNKTQNYQLNQWEAGDKVQRIDFNADNAKIDAAIKAVDARVDGLSGSKADVSALTALQNRVAAAEAANLWGKLADVTTTESQQQVDINLSQYNLSQFAAVKVYGQMAGGQFIVRFDNKTATYNWGNSPYREYLFIGGGKLFQMELSGFGTGQVLGRLIYGGDGAGDDYGSYRAASGATIRTINLIGYSGGTIGAGSRLTVYGLWR